MPKAQLNPLELAMRGEEFYRGCGPNGKQRQVHSVHSSAHCAGSTGPTQWLSSVTQHCSVVLVASLFAFRAVLIK